MKSTFAGLDLGTDEFAEVVRSALADVEDLLITELSSGDAIMTEAATHLAKAGGKRFRPILAYGAAECLGKSGRIATSAACASPISRISRRSSARS